MSQTGTAKAWGSCSEALQGLGLALLLLSPSCRHQEHRYRLGRVLASSNSHKDPGVIANSSTGATHVLLWQKGSRCNPWTGKGGAGCGGWFSLHADSTCKTNAVMQPPAPGPRLGQGC